MELIIFRRKLRLSSQIIVTFVNVFSVKTIYFYNPTKMKKSKAEKLTTEEIEGIKKLLQLRYGLEGTAKYPELKSYLQTSHRIKDTMLPHDGMTRLLYDGEKLYNVSDNDELNLWRDFITNERSNLLDQIPYASLYQNSYSINIDSAKKINRCDYKC